MNYRDYAAVGLIGSYVVGSGIQAMAEGDDNAWTMQHVYTDDETDIAYREVIFFVSYVTSSRTAQLPFLQKSNLNCFYS